MIKIHGVGGYDEVGKNMTALETGQDVLLFDAGLYLPAIVGVEEREKIPTERGMRAIGALPDDLYLDRKGLRDKVRALLISHGHLDHVGAVQYVGPRYKAGVYGTPFTIEVLKNLMEGTNIKNNLNKVKPNGVTNIKGKSKDYKVEFVNVTHSTIQCAIVAVHTPDGVVLYTNDYKLDNTPVLGEKPNYKRLKELAKIGVKAIIPNSLYAHSGQKTPSERIARNLLEDVLFTTDNEKSGIVITTFASHIARLKSITDFGEKLGREVVFFGRSLNKYVSAAINVGSCPFKNKIKIATYRHQVEKLMRKANNNKSKYLVVCTGHQGEPGAVLDRMSRGRLPYKISKDDHIIFSSKTIPTPVNIKSKAELEFRLKKFKPRLFDNIHVSGHGGTEDLRDLIKLTNPEHIIPSHGDFSFTKAGMALAVDMGYKKNYNVHLLSNGKALNLKWNLKSGCWK